MSLSSFLLNINYSRFSSFSKLSALTAYKFPFKNGQPTFAPSMSRFQHHASLHLWKITNISEEKQTGYAVLFHADEKHRVVRSNKKSIAFLIGWVIGPAHGIFLSCISTWFQQRRLKQYMVRIVVQLSCHKFNVSVWVLEVMQLAIGKVLKYHVIGHVLF